MVTDLLNTSHGVNVFIANCLHNNDPYEQPPTPEPTTSTSSVTPVPASSAAPTESGSGGDELIITGEEPDETTPTKGARPPVNGSSGGARAFEEEELKCTVNVAEKVSASVRNQIICFKHYFLILRTLFEVGCTASSYLTWTLSCGLLCHISVS